MATDTIPNSQGQIRQFNRGDTQGELWATFNCDLSSNLGKIKTSKKLEKVLDSALDLGDDFIQAFEIYSNRYYLATDSDVYQCLLTDDPTVTENWTKEARIAGQSDDFSTDMTVFNSLLLISVDTDMISWDGTVDDTDWWTTVPIGGDTGAPLEPNYPHMMNVHRGGTETLFVTDRNRVRYANEGAGHSTITLQEDLVASCVASGVNATWVGTYSESGSRAYVYEIHVGEQIGGAAVARNAFEVEGRAVLSIEVINNVPYIITETGNLQAFNGAGFSTVASFPFAYTQEVLSGVRPGAVIGSSNLRPIHPRGMRVHNENLYINLNSTGSETATTAGDFPDRTFSGIWEYSKESGLTHRNAFAESSAQNGALTGDRSGPILILDNPETFLLAAGEPTDGTNGMYAESDTSNIGFFITPEYESGTITDTFKSAYCKVKQMTGNENITLKYRFLKSKNQVGKKTREFADITFAETNVINTSDTLDNVEVGDEVTFITGAHAGNMVHITKIDAGTIVTSITIDTDIGTVGDSVRVVFENWKLHPESYTSKQGEVNEFGVGEVSPWIQYKVVLDGDIEFRQFMSKTNAKEGT